VLTPENSLHLSVKSMKRVHGQKERRDSSRCSINASWKAQVIADIEPRRRSPYQTPASVVSDEPRDRYTLRAAAD
jgi:hypothetical protein